MGVKLHIHKTHRRFTHDLSEVNVEGNTVGECLGSLVKQFPDIKQALFDQKGNLRNVIEIYLNKQSAYPDELSKPVRDGDEIHITVMLAGG